MSDSEHDEDLRKAIQLSLEDAGQSAAPVNSAADENTPQSSWPSSSPLPSKHTRDPVDKLYIYDPAEGKVPKSFLPKPIRYDKTKDPFHSATPRSDRTPVFGTTPENAELFEAMCGSPERPVSPPTNNFAGLNRKAMEQERLARAAAKESGKKIPIVGDNRSKKKQRDSISPPPIKRAAQSSPTQTSPVPSKRQRVEASDAASQGPRSTETTGEADASSILQKESTPSDLEGISFPRGVIKQTCSAFNGHKKTDRQISVEEVFQRSSLRMAVISAFQFDALWVLNKYQVMHTKSVFVMQAKDKQLRDHISKDLAKSKVPNLKLCFPPMEGQVSCMHSKLMLLSHQTHLRVAIPTANATVYDWGETGVMENSVFMVDVPRLKEGQDNPAGMTPFAKELFHFVQAMGLEPSLIKSLHNFDFANTKHLAFVHSIGGAHTGSDIERTGLCGLAKAVRELGLETKEPEIDFAASSVGSLNDEFLAFLYTAIKGGSIKTGDQIKHIKAKVDTKIRKRFRVYFPTDETVGKSLGGKACGGTVCIQKSYYTKNTFPKEMMRDYVSKREGLLSHNKILYVRGLNKDGDPIAWAYVGSANLSESAWGKIVMDRAKKVPKINLRNWESGVLFKVDLEGAEKGKVPDMKVFEDTVGIPFEYPGKEYDGRQPWYFMES
ncbi:phospholipase D/nuclease [Aulographum hederae CBS 113979]|uniref:Phospholipase D/nuclease n=1 Tax=Aulographum hederae CBS 113979 TaxID=1176131 RepID=A0A6G1GL75_9PEZI|nr:phospholipase D/nuclease [Aulographum hederae CBS 113979]